MRITLAVVAAGVGLLFAVPVWAHHAFGAEFDVNRPLKLQDQARDKVVDDVLQSETNADAERSRKHREPVQLDLANLYRVKEDEHQQQDNRDHTQAKGIRPLQTLAADLDRVDVKENIAGHRQRAIQRIIGPAVAEKRFRHWLAAQ